MCPKTFSQQQDQHQQEQEQQMSATNSPVRSMTNNNNLINFSSPKNSMERQIQNVNVNVNGTCSNNVNNVNNNINANGNQEYIVQRNRTPSSPRPSSTVASPTPVNYPSHNIYYPQPIQPTPQPVQNSHHHHIHHHQQLSSSLSTTNFYQDQQQLVGVNYFNDNQDENLMSINSAEFLPLCDLLFNIISLAAYFCDVVFDSVTVYTLYLVGDKLWFWVTLSLVLFSALISQILSLKWYNNKQKDKQTNLFDSNSTHSNSLLHSLQGICILIIHVFQFGVMWRYFKLFIPVDLSSVKHEVRDLCMLRMVHAFTEAAPMLIIQIYLMWLKPYPDDITDLNIISTFLSLFSLCWAMASFSKNVRRQNIHKLVLTWLGVIFQFLWRLGTVTSRVIALSIYATFYGNWVFIVIILHWFSMLLWLLSPKNLFHGEKMSFIKRLYYSVMVAWVYIFCYINMQDENSRNKMIAFYATMFLENSLLLSVCIFLRSDGVTPWYQELAILFIWGGFSMGILFMILYYKFFHIRHLKHTLLASHYDTIEYTAVHCPKHGNQQFNDMNIQANGSSLGVSLTSDERMLKLPILNMNSASNGVITGIPGVFNCRLNPALKRKKKKPSSFIPPPAHPSINNVPSCVVQSQNCTTGGVQTNTNINVNSNNKNTQSPLPLPTSTNYINPQLNKNVTVKSNVTLTSNALVPTASPTTFWKKTKLGNGFLRPITPATSAASPSIPSISTKHPFSSTIAPSPVANFINIPTCLLSDDINNNNTNNNNHVISNNNNSRQTPLKSPLNDLDSHHPSGTVSPRVDIQQKLQEKRQQQLIQLKKIEEEIKQGKLKPQQLSNSKPLLPLDHDQQQDQSHHHQHEHVIQPPQSKKQPTNNPNPSTSTSNLPFAPLKNRGMMHHYYYHPVYRRIKLRSQTPEVLLAPHYLDNSRVFYDYPSCVLPPILSRLADVPLEESNEEHDHDHDDKVDHQNGLNNKCKNKVNDCMIKNKKNMKNNYSTNTNSNNNSNNLNQNLNQQQNKVSSDIDSQVSLPRSYTLPREFRYYRGNGAINGAINSGHGPNVGPNISVGASAVSKYDKTKKKNHQFNGNHNVTSNSSIDGDVDSDINQDEYDPSPVPQIIRGPAHNVKGILRPNNKNYYYPSHHHHHHHHHHYNRYRKNVPETPL